jgi:hypothetical protein
VEGVGGRFERAAVAAAGQLEPKVLAHGGERGEGQCICCRHLNKPFLNKKVNN